MCEKRVTSFDINSSPLARSRRRSFRVRVPVPVHVPRSPFPVPVPHFENHAIFAYGNFFSTRPSAVPRTFPSATVPGGRDVCLFLSIRRRSWPARVRWPVDTRGCRPPLSRTDRPQRERSRPVARVPLVSLPPLSARTSPARGSSGLSPRVTPHGTCTHTRSLTRVRERTCAPVVENVVAATDSGRAPGLMHARVDDDLL